MLLLVTGYLYHVTSCLLSSFNVKESMSVSNRDILQTITKPLTKLIVQVASLICTLLTQLINFNGHYSSSHSTNNCNISFIFR